MEGPSLFLAQEQLKRFKKKTIETVYGNTSIEKDRFTHKKVLDIFSWGKHLVFQFEMFALRVHFLLYGTFSATVDGTTVTGDYQKARTPRLAFTFSNGSIELYNCSVKIIESTSLKTEYDFSIDIMSPKWNRAQALRAVQAHPNEQIADILLDQTMFAGVGNIIKNEVLSLEYINPQERARALSRKKIEQLIKTTELFSHQFYLWRKKFVLRKNLKIHRRSHCPHCGTNVIREKTGIRNRLSYYCPRCQPLRDAPLGL